MNKIWFKKQNKIASHIRTGAEDVDTIALLNTVKKSRWLLTYNKENLFLMQYVSRFQSGGTYSLPLPLIQPDRLKGISYDYKYSSSAAAIDISWFLLCSCFALNQSGSVIYETQLHWFSFKRSTNRCEQCL